MINFHCLSTRPSVRHLYLRENAYNLNQVKHEQSKKGTIQTAMKAMSGMPILKKLTSFVCPYTSWGKSSQRMKPVKTQLGVRGLSGI